MNRRRFLTGSALLGVPLRGAARPAQNHVSPGFHLGAVTYNVLKDFDVDTIISMLEAAGFEGVELRTGHKHGVEPSIGPAERTRVRQLFEKSKVRLISFGTTCEFHSPDAAERRRQLEIARQFVNLAHDTGAWGIKVRPNDLPDGVPREVTIENIGNSLHELGDYGAKHSIEIWLEIHGRRTGHPAVAADIMQATRHPQVGLCWNSDPPDVIDGSIAKNFELARPWIRHCHINELTNNYPWRELFTLLRGINYRGYTLCEAEASREPSRFLQWYRALWTEMNRNCG
ncbi:MAG: sugar phosphate isomerase/epimerase family protein [Bryobacteraceae bacterium]